MFRIDKSIEKTDWWLTGTGRVTTKWVEAFLWYDENTLRPNRGGGSTTI